MAGITLYQFYKAYFSYPGSSRRTYARAIGETNRIIKEIMEKRSINPILNYYDKKYSLKITKQMLRRLVRLIEENYTKPFDEIDYFETDIIIEKKLLSTRRKEIKIKISGGIDRRNKKLILPAYSSSFDIVKENNVFAGLIKEFPASRNFGSRIAKIEYWNLSRGEIASVDVKILEPADKQSLINAANNI